MEDFTLSSLEGPIEALLMQVLPNADAVEYYFSGRTERVASVHMGLKEISVGAPPKMREGILYFRIRVAGKSLAVNCQVTIPRGTVEDLGAIYEKLIQITDPKRAKKRAGFVDKKIAPTIEEPKEVVDPIDEYGDRLKKLDQQLGIRHTQLEKEIERMMNEQTAIEGTRKSIQVEIESNPDRKRLLADAQKMLI